MVVGNVEGFFATPDDDEDDCENEDDDMEAEIQDYIDRHSRYDEDLHSIGQAQTAYESYWYR